MSKNNIFLKKEKEQYRRKIERFEKSQKEYQDILQNESDCEDVKKKLADTELALYRCRELLKYIESLEQQNK